jgi:signal transduction histidine kinase
MALGRAERVPAPLPRAGALTDARELVEELLQTVRDLSLGLRPSMLDDFGLGPALEWLVRDFQRRSGIDARLTIAGPVAGLNDAERTCIYRVVQEALTNCAKHASASRVDIDVRLADGAALVSVGDDGRGMPAGPRPHGLGLVGIEERARELGGRLEIKSAPGRGTQILVHLPVSVDMEEGRGAVAAG